MLMSVETLTTAPTRINTRGSTPRSVKLGLLLALTGSAVYATMEICKTEPLDPIADVQPDDLPKGLSTFAEDAPLLGERIEVMLPAVKKEDGTVKPPCSVVFQILREEGKGSMHLETWGGHRRTFILHPDSAEAKQTFILASARKKGGGIGFAFNDITPVGGSATCVVTPEDMHILLRSMSEQTSEVEEHEFNCDATSIGPLTFKPGTNRRCARLSLLMHPTLQKIVQR